MKLLHISDMHFGPYHWGADDEKLLERLNAIDADIILNTGDLTSDSLQVEFEQAGAFLSKLKCPNIVSIPGNHDKYSKRSHEMFRQYICNDRVIAPKDPTRVKKRKVFIDPKTARLDDYYTEINYLREFVVDGETVLIVCIDTNLFQDDQGKVEIEVLEAIADTMARRSHDRALMLTHHSVLSTDEDPLINSKRVVDFILAHGIEATFCGHTHELDIIHVSDIVTGGSFRQFMCGSLASVNIPRDRNMFCTYENFGSANETISVTRMTPSEDGLIFEEAILGKRG